MHIQATETSPEVFFEEGTQTLTIRGKALNGENNVQFYKDLEDWTDNYFGENPPEKFTLNIQLEVIDINAGIGVRAFLKNLDYWNNCEVSKVQVNWFYAGGEIKEIGEEWLAGMYVDFEIIESENKSNLRWPLIVETREKIKNLNKKLYNAGFYFRAEIVEAQSIYIIGSFNPFFDYKDVDFEFDEVIWTNLKESENWADAWYDDQLFLLERDEIEQVAQKHQLEIPADDFVFQWNIADRQHRLGIIICKSLKIHWYRT